MARQARKIERAQARDAGDGQGKRKALSQPLVQRPDPTADLARATSLRPLLTRLGLPLLAVWVICLLIAGFSTSRVAISVALSIPSVLTLVAAGVVVWARRQASKAKGVAGILQGADTKEGRRAALDRLDADFKKNDPAAVFAKAQLLLQEDPDEALAVLEKIDLTKVMAPVADQARGQRAMIHLMKGEATRARDLVDSIELSRHQDARERAMLGAVIAEAWARTGQAKKAVETLEVFDPEDDEYAQLRPQIYRARAYAYAYVSRTRDMRHALRKLLDLDARLLGGFFTKKSHPLLQKEAKKLLEKSGQLPRKMVVQRRM